MSKLCALEGCKRRRAGFYRFCCVEHAEAGAVMTPKEQRTKDWPTADIVTLRKMWRTDASDAAIGAELGRAASSVCRMRGLLGLAGNGGRQRRIA